MAIETEVKIPITDPQRIKQKLLEIKAELFKKRELITDVSYDNGTLKKRLLRIRNNSILTYKGKADKKHHVRSNEEIEVMVDNGKNLHDILLRLGYKPYFKRQKYREGYLYKMTQIFIDETPIGNFIEIEGKKEMIFEVASLLGFTKKDFILKTYGKLWQEYAKKNKIKGDMVFK